MALTFPWFDDFSEVPEAIELAHMPKNVTTLLEGKPGGFLCNDDNAVKGTNRYAASLRGSGSRSHILPTPPREARASVACMLRHPLCSHHPCLPTRIPHLPSTLTPASGWKLVVQQFFSSHPVSSHPLLHFLFRSHPVVPHTRLSPVTPFRPIVLSLAVAHPWVPVQGRCAPHTPRVALPQTICTRPGRHILIYG